MMLQWTIGPSPARNLVVALACLCSLAPSPVLRARAPPPLTDALSLEWPATRRCVPLLVIVPGFGTTSADYDWMARAADDDVAVLRLRVNRHYTSDVGIIDLSGVVRRLHASYPARLSGRVVFAAHSMGTRAAHRSAHALQEAGHGAHDVIVVAFGVTLVPRAVLQGRRYAAVHVTGTEDCMTPPSELAWSSRSEEAAPTAAMLVRGANHRYWTDEGEYGRYSLAAECRTASRAAMHSIGAALIRLALAAPADEIVRSAIALAITHPMLEPLGPDDAPRATSSCCCSLLEWRWCV